MDRSTVSIVYTGTLSHRLATLRHPAAPARRCVLAQSETADAQTDLGGSGDGVMGERRRVRD